MKKPIRRFQDGGMVPTAGPSVTDRIKNAMQTGAMAYKVGRMYGGAGGDLPSGGPIGGNTPMVARGGKIKRTVGPKIGKEDGLIAAQKGEYVVKKDAVKKLGTKALNTINKGKLPARKGR